MAKSSKPTARSRQTQKSRTKTKKLSSNSRRLRNFKCKRTYHVFQRGNDGRRVFLNDTERGNYLEQLFLLAMRYRVKIHNFCLMPTHVHFVLEQRQKDGISNLMRDLQSGHAREQNFRRNTEGNVWTQHFGCKHVNSDAYYRTLMWYLGNNPVKTGAVARAADYIWSGAQVYAAGGPVTIKFMERELEISLHMDRYEKVCKTKEWEQTVARENVAVEMAEEHKRVESIFDRKAKQYFANQERVRRANAKKDQALLAKKNRKKFGAGRARQLEAAAKAQTGAMKKGGKGSPGSPKSMRAG